MDSTSPVSTPKPPRTFLRSAAVLGAIFALEQPLRFASNVLLARLLYPEALGLIALSFSFLVGLQLISDLGIRVALIQHADADQRRFQDTAWTLQVIRGLVLGGFGCLLAWPAAYWRETPEPQLLWLMPLLGSTALIEGFICTKLPLLQRHMQQTRVAVFEFVCGFVGNVVMIAGAWYYPSPISLVAGPITTSSLKLLGSFFLSKGPINRWCWDRESLRSLSGISRWTLIATACAFFAGHTDKLVLGLQSISRLGVYHIGVQLAQIPVSLMSSLSYRLVFPYYSRAAREGTLHQTYRRTQTLCDWLASCLAVGVAVTGSTVVQLAYDARYADAGWIVRLIAVGVWFQIIAWNANALMIAQGYHSTPAFSNFGKVLVLAVGIPLGTWLDGLRGMIIAVALGDVAFYVVNQIIVTRRGFWLLRTDFRWTLFSAGLCALGLLSGEAFELLRDWCAYEKSWWWNLGKFFVEATIISVTWATMGKLLHLWRWPWRRR